MLSSQLLIVALAAAVSGDPMALMVLLSSIGNAVAVVVHSSS